MTRNEARNNLIYAIRWNDMPKKEALEMGIEALDNEPKWIPVSEGLPEDLEPVNITWVNHEPEPYYHDIKDKNFVATGIHYRGKWYWYSTTCADYLGEYGSNEIDLVDDAIEIVAWMPLPEPYKTLISEPIKPKQTAGESRDIRDIAIQGYIGTMMCNGYTIAEIEKVLKAMKEGKQ